MRSLLGPPFLNFQFSIAPSAMVVCGTIHDLSVISYQSLSPFFSTLFSQEDWVDAILTLSQCSIDYLFCKMHRILILLLPSDSSRHNSPSRPDHLTKQLSLTSQIVNTESLNILLVTNKIFTFPLSAAISKAFSLFSMKTNPKHFKEIFVDFCLTESDKEMLFEDRRSLTYLSDGIRRAQLIVDSPANMMDTDGFFRQIKQLFFGYAFPLSLSIRH
ncbi:hypothetical protein LOD99_11963 [Oopsacas minuta]|uniref:Probable aminopeptidase NPEPL1 N-terminal domain-containing protein n=1 Tax=Oopsacas minuta TaxID=111878 RepID=A0AAV7JI84_9METZ|nr:hypothetical protein LOD99_11963 [Oopsacas minuta]